MGFGEILSLGFFNQICQIVSILFNTWQKQNTLHEYLLAYIYVIGLENGESVLYDVWTEVKKTFGDLNIIFHHLARYRV